MNMEIRQSIEKGFTLVTPTKRLGRALQQQYISFQLADQKNVWETPDILPWAAWIMRLWDDFAAQQASVPMLLNTQQQQWVWQQVVSESAHAKGLLQPSAAAAQAYDALKNARQWQLDIFPEDLWLNKDAFAFKSWVQAYAQRCEKNKWLDASSLEAALLSISPECAHQYAAKLCLVGFDELTPAQQSLLQALEKAGGEIKYIQEQHNADQTNVVIRTSYLDSHHELKAIAHWIREHLETNRDMSIGVIIPELENLRSDVENIFDDVLTPGNLFADEIHTQNQRPYNLSLGKPLAEYPIIDTAFGILGLNKIAIEIEDLGALLRSPFIKGAETEMIARAQLDAHLRDQGEPAVYLIVLQQRLEKDEYWMEHCPELIASLQTWREVYQSLFKKQSCTAWIESFISLLNSLGWSGERQLSGDEFQTIEAWRGLLDQFSSLDLVSGELTYNGALSLLQRLAREHTYQVESNEVPVQVMGLLEAAGMQFDQLWVMGLHEENWPPTASANPFLPIKLQRQEKMPHASAERELEYARRITSRLAASANKVNFSTPLSEAGRELRPSPLLKQYPLQSIDEPVEINYAATIFDSSKIEHLHDDRAPEVKEAQASGGTGLFKDQAACPFRAFAKHRLGAKSLAEPDIGLSPMERGLLVHDCLQHFWEKVSTHKELIELTDGALALHINQCVAKVIKRFTAQRPFTATERFMLIETSRLQTMMHEWLSIERLRQPFTVVEREQKHFCSIEGLKIQTRLDRVDQLPDGSLIVIDYKTGTVAIASWMDERPDEPQLPLYAVTGEGNIAAVVFGQIKRGEMKFVGLADDVTDDLANDSVSENEGTSLIPDVKTLSKSRVSKRFSNWESLLMYWEQNLKALAKNFLQGDARVDPYKVTTCMYCDLGTLCRINELTQSVIESPGNNMGNENE